MNPESRAKNLIGQSQFARARGVHNRKRVLEWLMKYKFTSEAVLQKLLCVKRRVGADYVKRGVLRRIEGDLGFPDAFVLAPGVENEATELYVVKYDRLPPYQNFSRRTIAFMQEFAHSIETQLAHLERERELEEDLFTFVIRSEHELNDGTSRAIPDFEVTVRDSVDADSIEWHEIERNAKNDEALIYKMQLRHHALENGRFNRIIWHCKNSYIAKKIDALLLKERVVYVMKNPNGTYTRLTDREGWNPAALRSVSEVTTAGADVACDPLPAYWR